MFSWVYIVFLFIYLCFSYLFFFFRRERKKFGRLFQIFGQRPVPMETINTPRPPSNRVMAECWRWQWSSFCLQFLVVWRSIIGSEIVKIKYFNPIIYFLNFLVNLNPNARCYCS